MAVELAEVAQMGLMVLLVALPTSERILKLGVVEPVMAMLQLGIIMVVEVVVGLVL